MGVMEDHQLSPKNRFVALFLAELLEDFRLHCKRKTREDDGSQVSTELTLSCGVSSGFHNEAKKPKATERNHSPSLLTKFSMENPHEEEEEEEEEGVSTALKLYDESWVNPKRGKAMKDSAVNSKGEEKPSDSGLQTSGEEEETPQEGQERRESVRTLNLFERSSALKLYDESWVNPKRRKAMKKSAVNSKGEEKPCDSGLQTSGEEEGTPQEGQERSESVRTLNLFERSSGNEEDAQGDEVIFDSSKFLSFSLSGAVEFVMED